MVFSNQALSCKTLAHLIVAIGVIPFFNYSYCALSVYTKPSLLPNCGMQFSKPIVVSTDDLRWRYHAFAGIHVRLEPHIVVHPRVIVVTSRGPEAAEKWCWLTFCQFIVIISKVFNQGHCTGQLLRSNCPSDLHTTCPWPFASNCPRSYNQASHDYDSLLASDQLLSLVKL